MKATNVKKGRQRTPMAMPRPNLPTKPPARIRETDVDEEERPRSRPPASSRPMSEPPVSGSDAIVTEEEDLLGRIRAYLTTYRPSKPPPIADYEADMISLRD